MNIKFFIILLLLLLINLTPSSAQEIYMGNKLRSLPEQIRELRKECQYQEDQIACSEEIKRLQASQKQLHVLCHQNPDNPLCVNIVQAKKERVDNMRILCMNRPYERKCQQIKEQLKKKQKNCQNPMSPNCQFSSPKKPQGQNELLEHCTIYPRSKYCSKLNSANSNNNQKQESSKGLNTF